MSFTKQVEGPAAQAVAELQKPINDELAAYVQGNITQLIGHLRTLTELTEGRLIVNLILASNYVGSFLYSLTGTGLPPIQRFFLTVEGLEEEIQFGKDMAASLNEAWEKDKAIEEAVAGNVEQDFENVIRDLESALGFGSTPVFPRTRIGRIGQA